MGNQPTPIVKPPQTPLICPTAIKCKHHSKYPAVNVMNMQSFMNKCNKIQIFDIKNHQQKTINSYGRSA